MAEYRSFAQRALEAKSQNRRATGTDIAIGLAACGILTVFLSEFAGRWVEFGHWAAGAVAVMALATFVWSKFAE